VPDTQRELRTRPRRGRRTHGTSAVPRPAALLWEGRWPSVVLFLVVEVGWWRPGPRTGAGRVPVPVRVSRARGALIAPTADADGAGRAGGGSARQRSGW